MSQITTTQTAAGMGAVTQLDGNTGSATPTAGVINVISSTTEGTARTTGSGSTLTLAFSDADQNTAIGFNTLAAAAGTTGNTALGYNALPNIINTGGGNVAIGHQALQDLVAGGQNVAVGSSALSNLAGSGTFNLALGNGAGIAYLTTESSNILLNSTGSVGESNTLRIGIGSITSAYIAGIDGVNVGSVAKVVTMASDQLGTAVITAGTGITVTPLANSIEIASSASGGDIVLLQTQTASASANITFTSTYITASYTRYMIVFENVKIGALANLNMTFSVNNGSSYISTYTSGYNNWSYNSATAANTNSTTVCPIYADAVGGVPFSGQIYLYGLLTSSTNMPQYNGTIFSGFSIANNLMGGTTGGPHSVNNIRFLPTSGTITSGTISLYGINK